LKRICFTVINDLTYDQRMQRICSSLVAAGFHITLIGRLLPSSIPLTPQNYLQKRLRCRFSRGKRMYFEYNLRLLFHLLFISTDCYVAIDLDTIIPNYLASVIRKKKRVYDAHELFTELKEIIMRPAIHKIWQGVEKFAVPRFSYGYTVNDFIAQYFKDKYEVDYQIIRNLPMFSEPCRAAGKKEPFYIYQGAVNEGRSFETLIPAMKLVDAPLFIYGNGNFFNQLSQLIKYQGVEDKVFLMGNGPPERVEGDNARRICRGNVI
jgi:glycosyltransferase involved in cell wall biosynthesis